MKQEIANLKGCLGKCENKWNKIVRNTLRENADLKDENRHLKEKVRTLDSSNSSIPLS